MKLPDPEQFNFKDCVIGGDDCWLITPDSIKCKWTEDNLMFRSIIIRKSDNEIISRGYNKFFNFSEQPDLDKFPMDEPFEVIEKLDGSLIIWGYHKGQIIHRTRGTENAEIMPNGNEIRYFINKYPEFVEFVKSREECSILTEWQTNSNVIVIGGFSEPVLSLIGVIDNQTGLLFSQKLLDHWADVLGLNRPKRYHYNSIMDCINDVELWTGREGVVLYSENGQKLRKCKSDWYRSLHSMATGIKTVKNVLDVFMTSPKFQSTNDFFHYIERTMDHEIAIKCKDFIDQICEAYTKVKTKMIIVDGSMEYIKTLNTRKEQAQYIMERCHDWMVPYAFLRLDDKEMDDKLLRKALEHELKI